MLDVVEVVRKLHFCFRDIRLMMLMILVIDLRPTGEARFNQMSDVLVRHLPLIERDEGQ